MSYQVYLINFLLFLNNIIVNNIKTDNNNQKLYLPSIYSNHLTACYHKSEKSFRTTNLLLISQLDCRNHHNNDDDDGDATDETYATCHGRVGFPPRLMALVLMMTILLSANDDDDDDDDILLSMLQQLMAA